MSHPCDICTLCSSNAIVEFLSRKDIVVDKSECIDLVVRHEGHLFEGRHANVISATRMAMAMERKYKATLTKET